LASITRIDVGLRFDPLHACEHELAAALGVQVAILFIHLVQLGEDCFEGFHMRKALILWLVFDVGTDAAFWGWAAWQWLAG
jgi:hypothetical protein